MKKYYLPVVIILAVICLILAALLVLNSINDSVTKDKRTESYISGLLYQESAEAAAQYLQCFELAKLRLDEAIEENNGEGEGLYIVTDIDATLMDDSAYIAGAILSKADRHMRGLAPWNNKDWSGYYEAISTEAVRPVPGAQEFIDYASSKGVKTFFITNRPYYELDLTVKQLIKFGFIDEETAKAYSGLDNLQELYAYDDKIALETFKEKVEKDGRFELGEGYFTLKGDYTIQVQGLDFSSDKAERRYNVSKCIGNEGKIILYLGDNINDMISDKEYQYTELSEEESKSFSKKNGNYSRKLAAMDELWKDKWGTVFIIMPNSSYGDWLSAAWNDKDLGDNDEIKALKEWFIKNSYLNAEKWYYGPSPTNNVE